MTFKTDIAKGDTVMRALKCDFCGGNLVMDKSREFATCEFCGTKYTKETVQEKIQEIRGQVSIVGAVETVTGNAEKERLIKNAETYLKINEYNKAIQSYSQVTKQFPEDFRGWWGLFTTPIEQYFATGLFRNPELNSLRNAFNLNTDKSIFSDYFKSVMNRYGNALRTVACTKSVFIGLSGMESFPSEIDNFTYWIIYQQANNFPYYTDEFKHFITELSKQYENAAISGAVYMGYHNVRFPFSSDNVFVDASILSTPFAVNFVAKMNKARYSTAPITNNSNSPLFYKIGWGNLYADVTQIIGFYGKWIFAKNKSGKPITILSSREITKSVLFRFMGVCQHCGGRFVGVFKPICKNCGKPKDY